MDFKGFSELDKEDLVIEKPHDNVIDGMIAVDIEDIPASIIISKLNKGEWFVNFEKTFAKTLDGEIEISISED